MPKSRDPLTTARHIFDEFLSKADPEPEPEKTPDGKNVHAQALSKMGASKGGDARAKALSPGRRKQIAKKAAEARWKKRSAHQG